MTLIGTLMLTIGTAIGEVLLVGDTAIIVHGLPIITVILITIRGILLIIMEHLMVIME